MGDDSKGSYNISHPWILPYTGDPNDMAKRAAVNYENLSVAISKFSF